MHNRATNVFSESTGAEPLRPWEVDQHPVRRLSILFLLICLPLIVISIRLTILQTQLSGQFVIPGEQVQETIESIPTRNGRILSADGSLLAHDIQQFNVLVHYRWLEQPANELWLQQQARSRLSHSDRRDKQKLELQKQQILREREAMWHQLAELTGQSPQQLSGKRERIQKRIQRIIDNVFDHREKTQQQVVVIEKSDDEKQWWQTGWDTIQRALTTPPRKSRKDPVILKEELDYHLLEEGVSLEIAGEIESHPERYPGLHIVSSTQRVYPQQRLAAHLIGYRARVTEELIEQYREQRPHSKQMAYEAGDYFGKTGIERTYDRYLRGHRGAKTIYKNSRGEIIKTEILREPKLGQDVILTINRALQQHAEHLLDQVIPPRDPFPKPAGQIALTAENDRQADQPGGPQGGSLVAIDIHTGAILAAASAPRFDINMMIHPDPDTWERMMTDPRRPLFSRTTQMAIAPGSIFKTLTAIALLQSPEFKWYNTYRCRGYLDNPNRHRCYIFRHYGVGHGELDLPNAICQSCNCYFYANARRVGPHHLVKWADYMGFGRPTGIDIPGESGGNLPEPPAKNKIRLVGSQQEHGQKPVWYRGDTLGLAIGQSRLTVTPLQMVRLIAAIANDGYLVTPHLFQQCGPVLDPAMRPLPDALEMFKPRLIPGLSKKTLEQVREGMRLVVAHPRGTGYKRVRMEQVNIAGKTGTAEVGAGQNDHAWFAGFVPVEQPRIAFVVVLEHGGSGGRDAGPIAKKFIEAMLEQGVIQPTEAR